MLVLVLVVIGAQLLGAYTVAANYAQLIRQTNRRFFTSESGARKKTLDTLGWSSDYLCPRQQFTGSPDKLRIAEVNLRVLLNYPKERPR